MERRDFLKTLTLGVIGFGIVPDTVAEMVTPSSFPSAQNLAPHIKDYLHKMRNFNEPHKDDIMVGNAEYRIFKSVVTRLRSLENYAGHAKFQLMGLDEGVKMARYSSAVGEFFSEELNFLEMLFYAEASRYGFFGQKPLNAITVRIKDGDVFKVPHTGNYIYKGKPLETYWKIKKQLGEQVILTSGLRGVMKQFLLFSNKAYENDGNLSLASRSLAPPGYSYHGIGDFDVGQVGFGSDNFTERFTTTGVYRSLCDLGYLDLRYPQDNLLGVRFEPWHVRMNEI